MNGLFNRRLFLSSLAATGAGMILARCTGQENGGNSPATASQPATQAATGTAPATKSAAESATAPAENAATTPYRCPDLGEELFPDAAGRVLATAEDCPAIIVPRREWSEQGPDLAHIGPMNGVDLMTIHHSGFSKPWDDDGWRKTEDMVAYIREFHSGSGKSQRGWADIAYHFVIDRAGRVWQGRPLAYQGAHARGHNQHNLGICVLGNFELQRPSAAQCTALTLFTRFLRDVYQLPVDRMFTHGELVKTDCPGKKMQEYVNRLRQTEQSRT